MRIDLPNDNWAELREPSEVSERGRRPVVSSLNRVSQEGWKVLGNLTESQVTDAVANTEAKEATLGLPAADLEAIQTANDQCIVALVREWSYKLPLTIDGCLDLPGPAYDKLRDACAPAVQSLFISFEPTVNEPDSPFVPSSESNGHSREDQSIVEIPSRPNGEPISSSTVSASV